jgi:protein Mpv17
MASFLRWYNLQLTKKPLLTNSLSATVLFGVGDALAQITSNAPSSSGHKYSAGGYDWERTSRACIYGGAIFAPIITKWWYPLLNQVQGSNAVVAALKRMSMDQLIFAPIFGVPLYFTGIGLLEGKSLTEVQASLGRNYVPTLLANWTIWPAFQFVNFMVIPFEYRLLAVNFMSIGWNTFLSLKNNRSNLIAQREAVQKDAVDGGLQ